MSKILKFAHKVVLVIIVLITSTSAIKPYSASAQNNAETDRQSSVARPQVFMRGAVAPILETNLLVDPGFEGSYGSTSGPWFQDPSDTICIWWAGICNGGYSSGGGWAGFGVQDSSYGKVWQDVIFPRCGARLEFHLHIAQFGPPGYGLNNYFAARIDGVTIFEAYGFQAATYQSYQNIIIPVNQFADGAVHRVEFVGEMTENFLGFDLDDVRLYPTIPASSGCAAVEVKFAGASQGILGIPQLAGDRQRYPVESGPVSVRSTNGRSLIVAERVAHFNGNTLTSFSELIGLPENLLSTRYSFPAYDNSSFNSQLRVANVSNSIATVRVYINGSEMTGGGTPSNSPYTLAPGASLKVRYTAPNGVGMNGGPLVVESSGGNVIASLRVLPKVENGSFSEIIGVPQTQVGTSYVFPWYNNVELNTQLRVANVSTQDTTVRLFIGGVEKTSGCTAVPPRAYPYVLPRGTALRLSCANVNSGPVQVVGNTTIVASLRVALWNGSNWTNFSEMMGMPQGAIATEYYFPWYNNVHLNTGLRLGNLSASTATVHVFIGGQEMINSPFTIPRGESIRQSFPVDNGPVKVSSNVPIVASLRVLLNNGSAGLYFSELMGLPDRQLFTSYIFPWYNNVTLNSQIRFAVP